MLINFKIEFSSLPGENIVIQFLEKKHEQHTKIILSYIDDKQWAGTVNTNDYLLNKILYYKVILKKDNSLIHEEELFSGKIKINKIQASEILIEYHKKKTDNNSKFGNTKPFKKVFKAVNNSIIKNCSFKKATHIFKVNYPALLKNNFLCLTGSACKMNLFNDEKPLLFKFNKNNTGIIKLNLSKEIFPVEYKIGIYDSVEKTIVEYEEGPNNVLKIFDEAGAKRIIHHQYEYDKFLWKGAGINIPVFSIRTANSWGSGDFKDLHLMIDYAASIGIKMLQLLPVNDTTSTLFDKDSYPYSAISSFALHPKLLCVQKMAYTFSEEILAEEKAEIQRLNKLSFCDHSGVMMLKFAVLKRIFFANTNNFITDEAFLAFFNANKEWLVPYAAFCSLRDNCGTLNYDDWGEFSEYTTDKIAAILEPMSPYYDEVLFWYFVQYHLHLQLQNASQYAHKRGVILKADLPIGVGRYSADTWVNPHLFHLDMQAGAPPDAFSTKGQNWSFPTYNIGVMASDNFAWFKKRMQQLENYFDAVRIDHVLGLFRIWSIPINQTDGTMGVFVPAIPANKENIINAGLVFNYNRFCTPFITEDLLQQMFGKDMPAIKEIFFDSDFKFKTALNDQQKIATYFKFNPTYFKYEQKLFDLISNVILFRDTLNANGYHFRINMAETHSYKNLSETEKNILSSLYTKYYYESQNELWKVEGTARLKMLKKATGMLLCAEDLGMVPDFTEEVLHSLDIISLQVQQMPKTINSTFSDTTAAKYESVVMPSTHDMQPIRLWWEKNKDLAQLFYNTVLNEQGAAPYFCEPWVCKKIIEAHLQSPAMWSIFLLQDLLAINGNIRRPNPAEERINDPSDADNVWNYRMHISVEDLMKQDEFNEEIAGMIKRNGR